MSYAHVDGLTGYAEEGNEADWKLEAELQRIDATLDELSSQIAELEERREDILEQLAAAGYKLPQN